MRAPNKSLFKLNQNNFLNPLPPFAVCECKQLKLLPLIDILEINIKFV
jgi:hypothetical protein